MQAQLLALQLAVIASENIFGSGVTDHIKLSVVAAWLLGVTAE